MTNIEAEKIKPAHTIVWSDYWKKELQRLGSYFHEEEIVIGGQAKESKVVEKQQDKKMQTNQPAKKNSAQHFDFLLIRFQLGKLRWSG